MKKISILVAFATLPFLMSAETYFREGMQWQTLIVGTQTPEGVYSLETVTLQKSTNSDWLEMNSHTVCQNDGQIYDKFIAYVKSDGDKVSFKLTDAEDAQTYLFYDFGLKEGEGCYIYDPDFIQEGIPFGTYIKCEKIGEDSEFPGWQTMSVTQYDDESCTGYSHKGKWIKGLSSSEGVLFNNRFNLDGKGGSLLWNAMYDGKSLYSNPMVNIKEITAETGISVKTYGLTLIVYAKVPTVGEIYNQAGMIVGNYQFAENPTTINMPAKGVYILKAGDKVVKIAI